MIPSTQQLYCCRCRSSALLVFGRLLPLDRRVTESDSPRKTDRHHEGDALDPRVRVRGTSDAMNPRDELPNGRPGSGIGDFTMPLKLEPVREGLTSVPSISMMAEMGDSCTVGHQARVADLAAALARQLGLSEQSVAALRMAALIHDLGKVWIPAEILGKPGKLISPQLELVQLHPQMGCEILQAAEFPSPFGEIILQHHERLDGSGYPHGLTGENILPEAKILAVADVMEAMTSPRPYRPSFGIDTALQEIRRGRGTVYDECVVDACLCLFQRNRHQRPTALPQ